MKVNDTLNGLIGAILELVKADKEVFMSNPREILLELVRLLKERVSDSHPQVRNKAALVLELLSLDDYNKIVGSLIK